MERTEKILFLSNLNTSIQNSDCYSKHSRDSGLSNSISFIIEMLRMHHYNAVYKKVLDENKIDREVTIEQAKLVFIEAIWVTPKKLKELVALHPKIKWVVRIHSEAPFLCNEGNATNYLKQYSKIDNVMISANSDRMVTELMFIVNKPACFLPNYYILPPDRQVKKCKEADREINIGCFGAIRPLKNQYIQALAAIKFADKHKLKLLFHMNGCRQEMGGNNIIRNIRALFEDTNHSLVEHDWLDYKAFIQLLYKIDIGMQVSLSETFNIVAADMVSVGIPVIGSKEIRWLPDYAKADPCSSESIYRILSAIYSNMRYNHIAKESVDRLKKLNFMSRQLWENFIDSANI